MSTAAAAVDATITWISGPVLRAHTRRPFQVNESVRVGEQRLLGEVIRLDGTSAVIQVYEDTTGLRPGDVIRATGMALSVPLGPGLLGNMFDGLQRPLGKLLELSGPFIGSGVEPPTLDPERTWMFTPLKMVGDNIVSGEAVGTVAEGTTRVQLNLPPATTGAPCRRVRSSTPCAAPVVISGSITGEDGPAFAITYAILFALYTWQWYLVHRIDVLKAIETSLQTTP